MQNLLSIIKTRHSTRGSFDPARPISQPHLELILEAARWAPTPNNMQNFEIVVVDDKDQLKAIGAIRAVMSEQYLRENYEQLSFSEADLAAKKSGILANTFPAAWTTPEAWSPYSDYTTQLTFLGKSMLDPLVLLVVIYDGTKRAAGSEGDVVGQMSLGCLLENMWLMSESLGIGFHVLTVFRDGPVDQQVKEVLGVPPHMKVAFACSLGYRADSETGPPRVRRDLEEFVHHNTFGQTTPATVSPSV